MLQESHRVPHLVGDINRLARLAFFYFLEILRILSLTIVNYPPSHFENLDEVSHSQSAHIVIQIIGFKQLNMAATAHISDTIR